MLDSFFQQPLEYLLWASVFTSILTSLIRACNIGFQRETYILSAMSLLPVIYDVSTKGSLQVIVFNLFHLAVAIFGAYRWHATSAIQKNHQPYDPNFIHDVEAGHHLKSD